MSLTLKVLDSNFGDFVNFGNMVRENGLLWTVGPDASLTLRFSSQPHQNVIVKFDISAFLWPEVLEEQIVDVFLDDSLVAEWRFTDRTFRRRALLIDSSKSLELGFVTLRFSIPTCAKPSSLGVNNDERAFGIAFSQIAWEPTTGEQFYRALVKQYGRNVGKESRKSFDAKVDSGFWSRFITGPNVLDVGFRGYGKDNVVPIVEGAIGIDLDFPGYDGRTLPFPTESQDAVYSSHCLEHIPDYIRAIQEWHRVTRIGGHVITVVPNAYLYERKRRPPSRWNDDHRRFYTPQSLVAEFEQALLPNSYRIRHLAENDLRFAYHMASHIHPIGCYEIELVIEKISLPEWGIVN